MQQFLADETLYPLNNIRNKIKTIELFNGMPVLLYLYRGIRWVLYLAVPCNNACVMQRSQMRDQK